MGATIDGISDFMPSICHLLDEIIPISTLFFVPVLAVSLNAPALPRIVLRPSPAGWHCHYLSFVPFFDGPAPLSW